MREPFDDIAYRAWVAELVTERAAAATIAAADASEARSRFILANFAASPQTASTAYDGGGDGPPWGSVIHDHADGFLDRLAGAGRPVTFQTFDDAKQGRPLQRILHGTLAEHWRELVRLNDAGAGVYVMVNAGDAKGRKTVNVVAVRALFLDLDGAPLEPVRAASPRPHLITETSPGRYHALWMIKPCAPDRLRFAAIQQALARRFGGDPADKDLARVCRVPGYFHRKGKEYLSRLLCEHRAAAYPVEAVIAGLGLTRPAPPRTAPKPTAPIRHDGDDDLAAHGNAVLAIAMDRIKGAPDGEQHQILNREAFSIGQLVAAGELPKAEALVALLWAAGRMPSHDPARPWTQAEAERQATDAFNDGKRSPRGLK